MNGHPREYFIPSRSDTPVTLTLVVDYPPTYPDVVPDMALEAPEDEEEGELREGEAEVVLEKLRIVVSAASKEPRDVVSCSEDARAV